MAGGLDNFINSYNNVVAKIGGIARHASDKISKVTSVFDSGKDPKSSSIRDAYLGGFLGDTTQFSPHVFSRLFDEPTYLTFRVEFVFNPPGAERDIHGNVTYERMHDFFPEPLLNVPASKTHYASGYSSWYYLKESLGEVYRSDILWSFIAELRDIAENYSYYFQTIEGLGDLMKVHPQNGIRIKDDEGIIKIKCLEGLDMKITQLMQLYRKVVWDDVYQRWILPDMMRYFTMKIYVSEIRLFHSLSASKLNPKKSIMYNINQNMNTTAYNKESFSDMLKSVDRILDNAAILSAEILGTNSTITKAIEAANTTTGALNGLATLPGDFVRLCNNALNDVMPTICLECHQCEFVLEDTLSHINSLSASTSKEQTEPTISIKVGRVIDRQMYPLNVDLVTNSDRYSLPDREDGVTIMHGTILNDELLQRPNRDTESYLDRRVNEDIKITNAAIRMNPVLDTRTNTAMSYQLFNSPKDMSAMSLVYSVLRQFRPDETLSAATAIREIKYSLDHGQYSEMIKSAATDPEVQDRLRYTVLTNALENLSRSTATESSLSAMSRQLLAYLQDRGEYVSKATEINELDGEMIEPNPQVNPTPNPIGG